MLKKEIRTFFKNKRAALSKTVLESHSIVIVNKAIAELDLKDKKISIFLPIERFNEINTFNLIDKIDAEFCVPVIQGENNLKHIKYTSPDQLEINAWGIPEPTFGEEVDVKELDVVLVPLLAIDQSGYRVGYGKGFYDAFLSECRDDCQFIGLNYFDPIPHIEDVRPEDVKLHACITPYGFFTF